MNIQIGVYCPFRSLINPHQYGIARTFSMLRKYTQVKTQLITSVKSNLSSRINSLILNATGQMEDQEAEICCDDQNNDVIYFNNPDLIDSQVLKVVANTPTVVTVNFKPDSYIRDIFGKECNRQKEADALASKLDKVSLLHFYSQNTRERFLNYRGDFEDKSIVIPYFVPVVSPIGNPIADNTVRHILYIDGRGSHYGITALKKALKYLGSDYLKLNNIHITVVSKYKPDSSSTEQLTWFAYGNNNQVLSLMQKASIVVLGTDDSADSSLLIQAMINKCAIIVDNNEIRTDILGNCGIQIPFSASYKLVEALSNLIENPAYRNQLAQSAQQRANAFYHPLVVAQQYHNSFEKLINAWQ